MSEYQRIVWLASYPKSGNTWVRLLLGNLLGSRPFGDDEEESHEERFNPVAGISSNRVTFDTNVGIEAIDLTDDETDLFRPNLYRMIAKRAKQTHFVKTHDSLHRNRDGDWLFPPDCSIGAVYLVRDPLDVAVSYSHHRGHDAFDQTIAKLNKSGAKIAGERAEQLRQILGSWSEHYRSWAEQEIMPVLVVRYEDLLADTPRQLRRIVEFCRLSPESFACSIEGAVEAASFGKLQKLENEKGFGERPTRSKRFFRSGKSGDGRKSLSEKQQADIITHHSEIMRELGYLERVESD